MNNTLSLEAACEIARKLPCSLGMLPELMQLLSREDAHSHDVEKVLRKDIGLTASVLRLANTAFFYRGGEKCDSLFQAMSRLGNKEIYRLIVSSMAGAWLNQKIEGYDWKPGDLSRHSLCVAIAAEVLAAELNLVSPEVAYTAGVVHDVGRLALAHSCEGKIEFIKQHRDEANCSWREAEQALLGYDHIDVGISLLESWSYPQPLIEVASHYSDPSLAPHAHEALVVTIHSAKYAANNLGLCLGEECFRITPDRTAMDKYGYTEALLESKRQAICEAVKELIGIDGEMNWLQK